MDCILNQLDAFVDVDIKKCILEIDLRMNDKSDVQPNKHFVWHKVYEIRRKNPPLHV